MELYIMRHGQSDMNVAGKMQGHIDCPLNDTGRAQAKAAAQVLRAHGLTFDRIITSSLDRTRETAELATGVPRTEFLTDDRVIEIDYGELDGKTYEEMGPGMKKFLMDPVHVDPPAGIEPLSEVTARAGSFLTDLLTKSKDQETILVVSHGVAIRAMFGWMKGEAKPGNEIWHLPIDNCAIFHCPIVGGRYGEPIKLQPKEQK